MKQHEREYFISRIRSGIYVIDLGILTLKILPTNLEQDWRINKVYYDAYNKAEEGGFMSHDEMLVAYKERGLWTEEDEEKEKGLEKDIDRLKVELFQNKNKSNVVEQIRIYLKAGKEQLEKIRVKKFQDYENTCEGVAQSKKVTEMLKLCTVTMDGAPYTFSDIPVDHVLRFYGIQVLNEAAVRELARTEPWRNIWLLKDSQSYELFSSQYGNSQLNTDQKNLLLWSRMYDNVQESMDCPSDDVIEDDDMLDGWFIVQRKKAERQRTESQIADSTTNNKIANSDEIFVMAHNKQDAKNINEANTINAQKTKEQRANVINNQGEAVDLDFRDQRMRLQNQSNDMFKGKFGR